MRYIPPEQMNYILQITNYANYGAFIISIFLAICLFVYLYKSKLVETRYFHG